MGKISNLSSYGFNEQPQFDGFINSLKEKADTTEIAEQVKKQESDIKNINDINTKQDEQILGLNVDIKQSGNAFTFTQGGKNLAVINQENGEGSSVIGGSFSNGKLTLNNSNNTSVEIDASSLAFKGDATSIPNLDAYATKQWVEDKNYLTSHQSLDDYAKTSEVSGELAKKSNVGHTHQISDITDLQTQLNDYATEQWVENKGYLTSHQSLDDYAKKTEIPSLNGYATEQWVNSKGYLTSHQDLTDYAKKTDIPNMDGYATKTELSTKQDKGDYALKSDIKPIPSVLSAFQNDVGYLTTHQDLTSYAKKTDIPSLEGYATEQWVTSKGYLTSHQDISGKQDVLVSGTNIKTVNGATLLGSGNIQIEIGEQALASYAKTADVDAKLDKKANVQHTHEISDVTNLQTKLNGYALKTEIQEVPKFKTVNGQAITGSTDNIEITTDLSNY